MKVESIIATVLMALALAIGVIGAISFYIELEFMTTNTSILILFIAVVFIAIAGLSAVDRDWLEKTSHNILNTNHQSLIFFLDS